MSVHTALGAPATRVASRKLGPVAGSRSSPAASARAAWVTSTLASQLDAFRQKTGTAKEAPKVSADPDLQERLNALGYVASDSSDSAVLGIKDTGADPKDKVEVVNLLHRAEMFKEDMHFAEAVPLLEQVIALEPNLPITYLQLGTALSSLKDYEKALPILRKAQFTAFRTKFRLSSDSRSMISKNSRKRASGACWSL